MQTYRIDVATQQGTNWDGTFRYVHLFRTDWIESRDDAQSIYETLCAAYPTARVSLSQRPTVYHELVAEQKP